MTPRERVIAAIQHQETDYLPYDLDLYGTSYAQLVAYYGGEANLPRWKNHIVRIGATGLEIVAPRFTEEAVAAYEFPDASDPACYAHIPEIISANRDIFTIAFVGSSYFERSWGMFGMENVLVEMVANPEFMERIYQKILAFNLLMIDCYLQFDVDCVHLNDDWGQQKGLIMGPANWRHFIKPGFAEMAARIKRGGKYVYVHSCGDVSEIFPDLIDMGVDILNPFQPEAMDVFALKRTYGQHITFHGGISQQHTMARGTPDDVEREMREKIPRLGHGGGYMLAPSQGITEDTPPANIARFLELAMAQPTRHSSS